MSGHLSNLKRRLAAGLLALTTAVGLGGLTACNNDSSSHDADGINIVASTNVYGSIAKAIAGDKATVHSIIKDPSADPHSYEASPNDIATLKDADIAIVNGGGYDEFAVNALADHDQKNVITAYSFLKDAPDAKDTDKHDDESTDEHEHAHEEGHHHHHHDGEGPNEHVFYNMDVAKDVASSLTKKLSDLDPSNKTSYQDNEKTFDQRIDKVKSVLDKIKKQHTHARFLQTEPLAVHFVNVADMKDVTPEGFAEAMEEGNDVSALQVAGMRDCIIHKKADVFLYNTQNANSTTKDMRELTEKHHVPVVDLTETLPENKDYTTWMLDNANALADALNVK